VRTRARLLAAIVTAAVAAATAVAFATSATPSSVGIRLFQFRPAQIEIAAGTKVTWTNEDDIVHTVTSGAPDTQAGSFRRRLDGQGAAASVEFSRPGIYPYFCERHPAMRGEIRVN
jgi:plastocyanin